MSKILITLGLDYNRIVTQEREMVALDMTNEIPQSRSDDAKLLMMKCD